MSKCDLSIVIPCYKSGNNIENVLNDIDTVLAATGLNYEIIMVNDGSPDDTFEIISSLAKQRDNTLAVNLAKNSGQHAALMAGFHYAKGDLVATCEDDGQTQIEALPKLIEKINEGCDVAAPVLKDRGKRSLFRRFGTSMARMMGRWMIPRPKGVLVPIFFVARRFVIDEIMRYNRPYPYIEGLVLRTTYNIGLIEGVQKERLSGQSGYSLKKMINLWLNGFTSFSVKPLRFASLVGVICAILGFCFGIFTVIRKLVVPYISVGWSSIVAIMLFIGGLIMLMLGMIGEYIGRIYICINQSPQYVVRDVVGNEETITSSNIL